MCVHPWHELQVKGVEPLMQHIKPLTNKPLKINLCNSFSTPLTINSNDIIAKIAVDSSAHLAFQTITKPSQASTFTSSPTALMQKSSDTPLVLPVDKVSSTVPKIVSFTPDILRQCVGFQRADTLIPAFK